MITKEILAEIILDYHESSLPSLVERDLKVDLEIPLKRAITILGPRRSGKTFYLYSLIQKLLKQGIEKERTLYINFEDPKLIEMTSKDLNLILEVFYEIYPQNKKRKVWLFFDEIQNIKNWEAFIRSILDKEKAYVFISGSSSRLLSKELATSLRGRSLSYLLLPFSFKEFLRLKNIRYEKYLSSEEKRKLLNAFWKYFSLGGYPEVLLYQKEAKRIINEIIEVTIYRDLIERYKIRNIKTVKLMFNYLVKSKMFSIHKFYQFLKSLNIKISKNSLYNYLEYFQDAFIFFPLKKFSYSIKNIEQSIPKIYSVDNGLIEVIVGQDKSKKFENLVFLSLLRKGFTPNKEIFYFTFDSGEVDFLIKTGKKVSHLLQACLDISDYQTREREINSLLKAMDKFSLKEGIILNLEEEKEEKFKDKKIKFIPLWKWLLEE